MATVGAQASETSLLRYSRWMLYTTVAGMPLYVVRWHYGALPTTLLETLILMTVALYLIARLREGRWRPVSSAYDIPIVLLLVAGAISVVVAADHRAALGLYRAYFVEPVAIFYVAIDLLQGSDHMLRAAAAFAIGVLWELAQYVYVLVLPLLKFPEVYAGFSASATLMFWAFITGLMVLAGASLAATPPAGQAVDE